MTKTMLEIAFDMLEENKEVEFNDLWDHVKESATILEDMADHNKRYQEKQKSTFYKLLVLDGRFIRTIDTKWTLIKSQPLASLKKMKAFYAKEEIKE